MAPVAHPTKHPASSGRPKPSVRTDGATRAPKLAHAGKPAPAHHGAVTPKVEHVPKGVAKPGAAVHVPKQASGRYREAVGRRKTSVVRVRIYAAGGSIKPGIAVNGKPFSAYFPAERQRHVALAPLIGVSLAPTDLCISAHATGGGSYAQAGALSLALARVLVGEEASRRSRLKALGLLSRDPRMVEAKKFGSRKARRPQQWRKR